MASSELKISFQVYWEGINTKARADKLDCNNRGKEGSDIEIILPPSYSQNSFYNSVCLCDPYLNMSKIIILYSNNLFYIFSYGV